MSITVHARSVRFVQIISSDEPLRVIIDLSPQLVHPNKSHKGQILRQIYWKELEEESCDQFQLFIYVVPCIVQEGHSIPLGFTMCCQGPLMATSHTRRCYDLISTQTDAKRGFKL